MDAIQKAARWLASTPEQERPRPIIPHLGRTFGLTAAQAIAAIRMAGEFRRSG
jgi:hypothetical protein